ncbi:flagellar hook-length control protein FliK [Clostridioides sp. ZZV14-6150]|uniref:flagellar hook-length control protein FliK n=1 Tax=unclassified Clostridioides TaxID=2635829 RepID=UPI001D120CCB|nr:flagellar hook-length control protein FliK [Clostridioides sp. ZZV14-6150]MCC0727063.1 flagellar hook-length control protein FliK [Clostridioides sp. ZZV14-6045]MCC0729878.1 flagellar hook-length control protein FliK [Clostridioides sp. ZZV14-6048]MCC0734760.1 flagellar hook-length control protein FliK [Clostridioides sp. ZZV14-6009]MCC0738240.1 flagellar hook-length control protein FliK [Clostridioides sp. ZZV14-5902]WLD26518.1 Flagellar hook-length control protein FliK [Clostridioides dif
MKIQADSYNVIKDIVDKKSSSKNKDVKKNKFEDNLYKVTDNKPVKDRKETSNQNVSSDKPEDSDNECHLDEDKSNHLEDKSTYEKDCSKINEILQQLLNILKNNDKKDKDINSILNDIEKLNVSDELKQELKLNKNMLNKIANQNAELNKANANKSDEAQNLDMMKLRELLENNAKGNFEVISKTTEDDNKSIDLYNFDSNRMDNLNSNKQRDDSSDILEKLAGVNGNKNGNLGQVINKSMDINKTKSDNVNLKHIESNVMDDSIKAIKHMKTNDIQELTIKLRPKELGDMNIQLLKDNESMKAVVTVFNKDVFDSINKNITDLKQHLELTNVNIKDVSVQMHSDNRNTSDTFDKAFEQQNRQNNQENMNKQDTNNKRNNIVIEDEIKENLIDDDRVDLLA